MICLSLIRDQIPTTPTDAEGMLQKKYIVYPGVAASGLGTWYDSEGYNRDLARKIVALTCYSGYYERDDPTDCWQYDVGHDWYGP